MTSCLSKLKVTPRFGFPFKIPWRPDRNYFISTNGSTLLDLPSEFVEIDEDSESFLGLFRMVLVSLQSRSGGNLSRIFFGLRHHNCSGRMQFQSTQGNHSATPISMVRNTISCVLRLVKFTLKKIWKFLLWIFLKTFKAL